MNVVIDPVLREAAGLARQGRFAEACAIGTRALADREDPVLHALVGALHNQLGEFAAAVPHLQAALAANLGDITLRGNLVDALIRTGQEEQALDACPADVTAADPSLRLCRFRAYLTQQSGDFESAAQCYRRIIDAHPDDWASLNNLGNVLSDLGRFDDAVDVLADAARLAPDSPPIRLNHAKALLDADRFEESEAAMRSAAEAFPSDPNPLTDLFAFYKRSGREDESIAALRGAVARDPNRATLRSDLGQECAWRNLYEEAEFNFERALSLDPRLSPSYVGLASLYERTNREAELQKLRDRAAENDADRETVSYICALILKREGDFDGAYAAMEQVGEAVVAARRFNLRGQLLERLCRSDEAFEAFAEMNREWSLDPSQPLERAALYRAAVEQSEAQTTPAIVGSWSRVSAPPLGRPTPAFLMGFPRSGTTLLDTLLMGHAATQVLEEEAFVAEIERDLGGTEALASLSGHDLATARAHYFEKVAQKIDLRPDSLIVDKNPLHMNKLPVIHRLFPDAKIILALRHPCDVLLSCYITNFRLNNAMANFLTLEDASRLYDQSFRFFEQATALFESRVHTVVYERMIEDPRRELQPLMAFLGLDWRDGLLDHRTTAVARGPVSTASYSQITEPIYKRAAGRWTRYRRHLEPVFPVLGPWVERLGYSLDDGRHLPWPVEERPGTQPQP